MRKIIPAALVVLAGLICLPTAWGEGERYGAGHFWHPGAACHNSNVINPAKTDSWHYTIDGGIACLPGGSEANDTNCSFVCPLTYEESLKDIISVVTLSVLLNANSNGLKARVCLSPPHDPNMSCTGWKNAGMAGGLAADRKMNLTWTASDLRSIRGAGGNGALFFWVETTGGTKILSYDAIIRSR